MENFYKREDSLPVLYARGSYYEVGYNVGRTFCNLIKKLVDTHLFLNENYLPAYNTEEGKLIYKETLEAVTDYYPNYVKELQGISDGSGVPFYKLFFIHMDDVLPYCVNLIANTNQGCSTVCLNMNSNEIIGHTEDALREVLNNVYILNAKYTDSQTEEHFTAFCYAGLLPGYAMGYNKHGLVYSINVISAKYLGRGKLPRTFVTRALLAADSLETAVNTLECPGLGVADAFSVNLAFLNQPGERIFYNIEVSPAHPISNKSAIDVLKIPPGGAYFHANKFLHLRIPEPEGRMLAGSDARHETRERYTLLDSRSVQDLLSDDSHPVCTIFRSGERAWTVAVVKIQHFGAVGLKMDLTIRPERFEVGDFATAHSRWRQWLRKFELFIVATDINNDVRKKALLLNLAGFFDLTKRTWSIFTNKPNQSEPIAVFPLDL